MSQQTKLLMKKQRFEKFFLIKGNSTTESTNNVPDILTCDFSHEALMPSECKMFLFPSPLQVSSAELVTLQTNFPD
jgi:hypothetical protein